MDPVLPLSYSSFVLCILVYTTSPLTSDTLPTKEYTPSDQPYYRCFVGRLSKTVVEPPVPSSPVSTLCQCFLPVGTSVLVLCGPLRLRRRLSHVSDTRKPFLETVVSLP